MSKNRFSCGSALQRVFLGPPRSSPVPFTDVSRLELLAIAPLLALSVVIGLAPRFLLEVIEPSAKVVARMVGG